MALAPARLFGCLLVLAVRSAEGLRRTPANSTHRTPPCGFLRPCPKKAAAGSTKDSLTYFFKAHHKTGTALSNHLCDHMKRAVTGSNEECPRCPFILNTTQEGTWCTRVYSDGHTVQRFREFHDRRTNRFFGAIPLSAVATLAGENWRAVHVIRDPLTTFASAFVYDQKGDDHVGAGSKELHGLSLKDGLRLKAKDIEVIIAEMMAAHAIAMRDNRVIEVRMEDFKEHFDATTDKIFNFMIQGGSRGQRLSFQSYAKADDQNRWSPAQLSGYHITNPEQESKVLAALRELCEAGSPEIASALAPRAELGYGKKCPGPLDA